MTPFGHLNISAFTTTTATIGKTIPDLQELMMMRLSQIAAGQSLYRSTNVRRGQSEVEPNHRLLALRERVRHASRRFRPLLKLRSSRAIVIALVAVLSASMSAAGATTAFQRVVTLTGSSSSHDVFKRPTGAAVSLSDGTVYIADRQHHRVQAVSPDGLTRPVAPSTSFVDPTAVAVSRDFLYITDGNAIRRISLAAGEAASTVAGSEMPDGRDGVGPAAGFKQPMGLAFNQRGEIVVADTGNHKIRLVTPTGVVSTIAGDGRPGFTNGSTAIAQFKGVEGVAVAPDGTIYVADTGNHTIRGIRNGAVFTVAGTGQPGLLDGEANLASFKEPSSVAIDDFGTLYVADRGNHAIRRISDGVVSTVAGTGIPGLVNATDVAHAQFAFPSGVAAAGALYVADSGNDALRVLYPSLALSSVEPRRGDPAGGEILHLYGMGFVPGATAVTVGGVGVAATYVSSTELVVTAPPHAIGFVDVVVTTPAGSRTLVNAFEYVPPFVAIVISPSNPRLDPHATVQLSASGVTAGGTATDITPRVAWNSDAPAVVTVDASGLAEAKAPGTATITASLNALAGSTTVTVRQPEPVPPDPVTTAPPLATSATTSFIGSTEFLYSGPDAIQQAVAPGTIKPLRSAVIRGRVFTRDGQPLRAVQVTISKRPEYGSTATRDDGRFDIAVNGGSPLVVRYEKNGYIGAERTVLVPSQDFAFATDVVLSALDATVTTVAASASAAQVARGSLITDASGSRQATLVFSSATATTLRLSDGTTANVPELHVRATEFSVGADGPKAMPAALPPQSGYTYCVELSADEAIAANAKSVQFSKPVSFYVENFLGFPVGQHVPVGYYDRDRNAWLAMPDGRVVRVVTVDAGVAHLDTDGNGTADDAGIATEELQRLGALYAPGATLWRVTTTHFSSIDLNWACSLPPDATLPKGQPTYYAPRDNACTTGGSIIECENQTLGEDVGITGTSFALHYRSDRTEGRVASRTIDIPVTGDTVPASLKRAELEISIAGTLTRQSFTSSPKQTYHFVWNGRDAYGRVVQGGAPITIRTIYYYDGFYQVPTQATFSFGQTSGIAGTSSSRIEVTTTAQWQGHLGAWHATGDRIGGWTITPHHFYDVTTKTLYRGDGSRKSAMPQRFGAPQGTFTPIMGKPGVRDAKWTGNGGPAKDATFSYITSMKVGPDGTLYIGSAEYIHKITPDGTLVRIAGNGAGGVPTTTERAATGPALQTRFYFPDSIAVAPDGTLFVAEPFLNQIRVITPDGTASRYAGTGVSGRGGDGVPAAQTPLALPSSVALAPDGSLYVAEPEANRIRRITPDRLVYTVAGSGLRTYSGDGGPALNAGLVSPRALTLASDGTVYFFDALSSTGCRIRRVTTDGMISTVAGGVPCRSSTGDGGAAADALVSINNIEFGGLAVGPDDSIIFVEQRPTSRVRRIDPSGTIDTVLGSGTLGSITPGALATGTDIGPSYALAVAPNGTMYFADDEDTPTNSVLYKVEPPLPPFTGTSSEIRIADGDLVYVFTEGGRHLRTLARDTNATLYSFGYDGDGVMTSITDFDGNVTRIERSGGDATAIVAPGGQRTEIAGAPYATTITTAPGQTTTFTYADGLMQTLTDSRRNTTKFEWDELGLLRRDSDPEGGAKTLTRRPTADGHEVAIATAGGRTTHYTADVLKTSDHLITVVSPAGLIATTLEGKNGVTTSVRPDGATRSVRLAPDPVSGMLAPFEAESAMIFPSGRTFVMSSTSKATMLNPSTPATRTETFTVAGKTFTRLFDIAKLTEQWITPTGRTMAGTVDAAGRRRSTSIPSLATVSFTYNSNGTLASVAQGSRSQSFAYNARIELTSMTDALHRTTSFEYDNAGRVTKEILSDLREITFSYDPAGNLLSVTPPGRPLYGFAYNKVNLPTLYAPPRVLNGGATVYHYNADRELTSIERPDRSTIELGYDGGGRLTSLTWPSGALTYDYLSSGALHVISGAEASLTYDYDGSLLTGVAWTGALSGSIRWAYTPELLIASETVGGDSVDFGYDDDGLLVSAGALHVSRNAAGLPDASSLGVAQDVLTLNEYGEASSYSASASGAELLAFDYTRDDAGRVIGIVERTPAGETTTGYSYDSEGRLTDAVHADASVHYDYDDNGNRVARHVFTTSGATTETMAYDAQDRLLNYEGTQYTYTANGELLSKTDAVGTTRYEYDALGNLRRVSLPDGASIEYIIDAQNRRVGKKLNGTLTATWLYADQFRIVAELDPTGAVVSRFVYGSHSTVPDYMIRSGVAYRIYTDHVGSPRVVVDTTTGMVAQLMAYDEFGNVVQDTNPGLQPFGFAGGLYDASTALVRFGARDYDPHTGRWTSTDPAGFAAGSANLYGYASNDPVNQIDPSGLVTLPVVGWVDTGETSGEAALEAYADTLTDPDAAWYSKAGAAVGGTFAALWTRKTSDATATTLVCAYSTAGVAARRPYWRYTGPRSKPEGPWLTRGWRPPYGNNFTRAKDALQLPETPTGVVQVTPGPLEPVAGPRVIKGNPQWGTGGGVEYYRGFRFPN
ncbi:MAG TPA: RHS repeat-associated core domain-containing protein [Thermoanaerobaculia bacterium]|jgi:RHS repeat-associated protein